MKKLTRILCVAVVLTLALSLFMAAPSSAITFDNDVEVTSDSLLMVNLDTGMEVYSKNADVRRYPAALTKVMTYIVAVEAIEDFDTRIEVKESVINYVVSNGIAVSGLDWHAGEKLTLTDILYALMVPRGNDAAMVLADYVGGGSVKKFVDMMNDKAEELGCKDTHFTNPTGVDDANHYSTARDIYLMCKYAMGLPMFSKICNTATYYMEGDDYPLVTTNSMIDPGRGGDNYYMYATGLKNGGTVNAGSCLAATAVCDGYAYICICLHAPYNMNDNTEYCMTESANLFRWAFLNLCFVTPATKDTPICEQKVTNAWDTQSVLLVPESDLNIVLPDDYSENDISIVPDNTTAVAAPIKKGDFVTTATVYYKDQPFTTINLLAGDSVSASPLLSFTHGVAAVLTSGWFLTSVGVIVVLFVIYVSVSTSYAKKKRKRK